jgi:hypothetical protein
MDFLLWKIVDGVFNSTSEVKCKEFVLSRASSTSSDV